MATLPCPPISILIYLLLVSLLGSADQEGMSSIWQVHSWTLRA